MLDFTVGLIESRKSRVIISQGKLAEYFGIKRQQISNYEVGQRLSLEIAENIRIS